MLGPGGQNAAPVTTFSHRLLTAHLRPDLVERLVFVCGVFHHDGWLPGSIELDAEADEFLGAWYGEVSPDGPGHWPVLARRIGRVGHHRADRSRGDDPRDRVLRGGGSRAASHEEDRKQEDLKPHVRPDAPPP